MGLSLRGLQGCRRVLQGPVYFLLVVFVDMFYRLMFSGRARSAVRLKGLGLRVLNN